MPSPGTCHGQISRQQSRMDKIRTVKEVKYINNRNAILRIMIIQFQRAKFYLVEINKNVNTLPLRYLLYSLCKI